jgi:hypothetical protein
MGPSRIGKSADSTVLKSGISFQSSLGHLAQKVGVRVAVLTIKGSVAVEFKGRLRAGVEVASAVGIEVGVLMGAGVSVCKDAKTDPFVTVGRIAWSVMLTVGLIVETPSPACSTFGEVHPTKNKAMSTTNTNLFTSTFSDYRFV